MADTATDRSVVTTTDPQTNALATNATVPAEVIEDGEGGVMTLREHLAELQGRVVKAFLALVAGFIVGAMVGNQVLQYLARVTCAPGETDCRLIVIDPTEGMITYLKVSLYIGVALSLPVIAYQIVKFMAPGLTSQEKRMLYTALPFVAILFAAGSAFAVLLVLPAMLGFLRSFMEDVWKNEFRAAATVSMALTVMLWMGLVFEMPLIMVLLAKLRIVHWRRMLSWWRYAVVVIMIGAAIITPTPDPVNMLIVATPMAVLYVLGIGLARVFGAREPSALPTSVAP
jgi:sec-independent protein translocase protein TatC